MKLKAQTMDPVFESWVEDFIVEEREVDWEMREGKRAIVEWF